MLRGGGLVTKSYPTLCDPMDCSLPVFSVHGVFQARILKWVAISFSRGTSRPRDQAHASCITGRSLPSEPPGKPTMDLSIGRQNILSASALSKHIGQGIDKVYS